MLSQIRAGMFLAAAVVAVGYSPSVAQAETPHGCEGSIAEVRVLAASFGVTIRCESHADGRGLAGWYSATDRVAHVVDTGKPEDSLYMTELAVHEIGHGWDSLQDDLSRAKMAAIVGGAHFFDGEWFADVFALSVGRYRGYEAARRWRNDAPRPTAVQLEEMRLQGLLPQVQG